MAVKTFNPTSPARRNMTVADYSSLTKKKPEKSLLASGSNSGSQFVTSVAATVVRSVSLTGREQKMVSRQQ